MGDTWDAFWAGFWQGFLLMAESLWRAMVAHPWLSLVFGFIVVGGLYLQLAPRRRRRRSP